jgi:hypothetical protein
MIVSVRDRATGAELTRYAAATFTDIDGYPQSDFDHVEYVEDAPDAPIDPAQWRIYVGAFFDRFGADKIAILASDHPLVQALIKDASVRQYIGLVERKAELTQMLGLLQSLVPGAVLDVTAILETPPTDGERYAG